MDSAVVQNPLAFAVCESGTRKKMEDCIPSVHGEEILQSFITQDANLNDGHWCFLGLVLTPWRLPGLILTSSSILTVRDNEIQADSQG